MKGLSLAVWMAVAIALVGCGASAKAPRAATREDAPVSSTPAPPDDALKAWIGVFFSPSSAYRTQFTVELRRGVPTVTRIAEATGDREVFEVRSSAWSDGTLTFSYYVPSTSYLVSYVCTDAQDDALVCKWKNDHAASGQASLPRVGGAGATATASKPAGDAQARAFEGVWQDPDTAYKTNMTVQLRAGSPTVVRSAETTGDLEVYEVRTSTYEGGTLRWSHFVPSTSYLVTYTCKNPGSDTMSCRWFNDHAASGSVVLQRVGGGGGAPPQADGGARAFEGVWQDPDTAYKTRMTVQLRGGTPTVVRSAESTGDLEVYEVRTSSFQNGTLRWSHFVPSTSYLVTYSCATVRGDAMVCKWFNDHNASGSVNLERVGAAAAAPGTDARAFEGVWQDPNTSYKTNMTVALRAGVPTVTRSAESMGDREVYEVRTSSFQGGTLRWSHFVRSTGYLVTYTCDSVRGDTMVCRWSNDHEASGSVNLRRVGGGAAPPPPPPPPPPQLGPKQREDSRD